MFEILKKWILKIKKKNSAKKLQESQIDFVEKNEEEVKSNTSITNELSNMYPAFSAKQSEVTISGSKEKKQRKKSYGPHVLALPSTSRDNNTFTPFDRNLALGMAVEDSLLLEDIKKVGVKMI